MDYKIVIDAGHGGDDPGASGNGIIEKDLTLQISQDMYDRFRNLGIPVTMTRTTDETLDPSERVNRILNAYGNRNDVIVISNHINAGGGDGAEVIYALRNNNELANLVLSELEKTGQNVRKVYQRRLPSNTSKDYYFIHRDTGVTQPIIVEYGFLDSTGDDVSQLKNDADEFANAVVNAVVDYIGLGSSDTGNYYTVKSGDSLWSIAKKFNTTVSEIKTLNNLTSNSLSIGQRLMIPEETSSGSGTYTVKAGDTLYSIARNYGISADELKSYNNLTSTSLSIGQTLKIPEKQTDTGDYTIYTVKSGDNLYSIARQYDLTMDELMRFNNLNSTLLRVGQTLRIPRNTTANNDYITYIVKSGDNLYAIARNYNISVQELMAYNNLSSNLLSIGQTLRIPMTNTSGTYTVKSGDTLYSIARQYNTTVDNIITKNNLTSNALSIGQKLII